MKRRNKRIAHKKTAAHQNDYHIFVYCLDFRNELVAAKSIVATIPAARPTFSV